ncbi:hypothetical protein DMC30DRAFT_416764 [Rhodotorula diobovata]|uniref:Proteophosphoglycan ppg4 n=1 Tax=Rhodotorula diobovata TaxID=5288 RepID=A0A5C5FUY2_9BASI|nr:hypothetical protein DMC30DRAFT_416764 [Rhodotorula diobovata]
MQKSASADAPRPRARTPASGGAALRERPQSMLWGSTSAIAATRAANEPPRPTSPSPTRWRRPLLPTRGGSASAALSDGAATARRGHGHGHGHGRSTSLGSVLTLARGARAPTTAEVAREPPQQLPPLRKKTSLAAMKTLLAASTGGKDGDHPRATGKERAAETETVTDEELAAWREAGRAKRAGNKSLGSRVELGERMGETGEGVAAGEEEDEVLIIRSRGSGDKVDTAPGFSPTRLPYGMDAPPFSSLIPSPSHSPRPASPPASSRRSSNAPSIAFSPSRRPSDGSVLVSVSRRPSDSPAPVAPAARPKTPTPRLDPGALNVLEFVAVDEGGKGDEEIPLRFPQTSGAEPEGGLAPSAISSFPPPLRRSSSSTSSRLSLGSEEGMVLSLLDGDGDASALLFPSSPQLGGTSPVPGARPLIAPKPAPESSLPPSMQHLFATPGAPRRPGSAAGGGQGAPLSSPSRRAAAPAPIRTIVYGFTDDLNRILAHLKALSTRAAARGDPTMIRTLIESFNRRIQATSQQAIKNTLTAQRRGFRFLMRKIYYGEGYGHGL